MTYYTHINRGVIDSNRKRGTNEPPICFRRGKRGVATYAHAVELPAGSRLIYSPHTPILPCGARLVVVSEQPPLALSAQGIEAAAADETRSGSAEGERNH